MPELPEVETIAAQLNEYLAGGVFLRACLCDSKLSLKIPRRFKAAKVVAVERSGKQVVFLLQSGGDKAFLVVHLRMTGRLIFRAKQRELKTEKCRAVLHFDRGVVLFQDVRRFGTIDFHLKSDSFKSKGCEPLGAEFTNSFFAGLCSTSKAPIKQLLLTQEKVVGLGNIYACEVLFKSRIDPSRLADTLSAAEVKRLRRAIQSILKKAILYSGTTFSDFVDATRKVGGYQRFLSVYNREGSPCPECGEPIQRVKQQGRSTYYCRRCQL